MEENYDTINLEYIEPRKASLLFKIVAFLLVLIFAFMPINEVLTQYAPTPYIGWSCQPSFC